MNSSDPSPSCRPTKVEVLKELSKVSMVNTSLKKLKHHLAGFDVVVKERTTATAITEGSKVLECEKCLKLETELLNKKDFVEKEIYDKLFRSFTTLENHCISLEIYKQLYDSIKPACDALITQINAKSVENSDKNAQLQEKVFTITALKEELRKLKGKSVVACRDSVNKPKVIAPVVHKVDMETLSPKLKNNREAHEDYIRITKENADTVRDIVEQARYNTLCFQVIDDVDKSTIHFSVVASDDLRDALSVIFGLSELKEITSDEEVEGPMKDQPLSADASPTALSPGYIANSDPEEDKEDPEEDPADHPADG
ncbi:hypothetical protein Tco_0000962 [Tanacetum coccineum]